MYIAMGNSLGATGRGCIDEKRGPNLKLEIVYIYFERGRADQMDFGDLKKKLI